ncbi:hypothetical protein GCM10023190_25050 [Enteractinococcus fodinae]
MCAAGPSPLTLFQGTQRRSVTSKVTAYARDIENEAKDRTARARLHMEKKE